MGVTAIDWAEIGADPRFHALHRKKSRVVGLLMLVSMLYYFLLPVGATWFSGVFAIRLAGGLNLGIVFAISEFAVALTIAALYTRHANREFDRLADEINQETMLRCVQGRRP